MSKVGATAIPSSVALRVLVALLLGMLTLKVWSCESLAKTELETIFCKIKSSARSLQNMTIQEFRNNPPQTQRLLLARPAKKMGLSLPALQPPKPPSQAKNLHDKKREKNSIVEAQSHRETMVNPALQNCLLVARTIRCPDHDYLQLFNRTNKQLDDAALSEQNRLQFPEYLVDQAQPESHYLKNFYEQYLLKMLSIGLAEYTLSYTKFVNLFRVSNKEGVDFAGRMETMFEYLKADKKTMQVKISNDSAPDDVNQCYRLSAQLIVCDDVQTNWVFAKSG